MSYKDYQLHEIGKVRIYKRKGNRSLRLSVSPEGDIKVSIPVWAPYQAGLSFVHTKKVWIQDVQVAKPQLLAPGVKIGKAHQLMFYRSHLPNILKSYSKSSQINVYYGCNLEIDHPEVQNKARDACIRALRSESEHLLGQRLEYLSKQFQIPYNGFKIKQLKSRWGSCDQHGNIVLNLFLIQLPWNYIDYVIKHELTHRKILHHGPIFWQELSNLCPNAMLLKKGMKQYKPTLINS